ncbi:hypothetical protein Ocin01_19668, partial [Orchesella cincta]
MKIVFIFDPQQLSDATKDLNVETEVKIKSAIQNWFRNSRIWRVATSRESRRMSSYRSKRRKINIEVAAMINRINSESSVVNQPIEISDNLSTISSDEILNHDDDIVSSQTQLLHCSLENNSQPQHTTGSISFNSIDLVETQDFSITLANWSIDNNINHTAVSKLLRILKPNVMNPENLPLSAKTLLKTPRTIHTTAIGGGNFYYFGVSKKIVHCINEGLTSFQYPIFRNVGIENLITLSISTDGIPIFKSSNIQMWPLLFKIDQALLPKPQVAGIFCGETKPTDLKQFMSEFVREMLTLEKEGLLVNGKKFNVRISCIIADAPARSFIKSIKGHTAYHGCERCIDEGEWQKRIVYSVYSSKLRTDTGFVIQEDKDHHVGISPLVNCTLGMVSQIVLDYMHLACLGVMRKLVFLWLSGPVSVKLSVKQVREVSLRLEKCKTSMPIEFSRKPRSLRDINRFKATEFRTLLLYTGPLVFKGILKEKVYRHFMLFSCAFKVFLSDKVYNSNWLTYGPDDAKHYGKLDYVSAFPFETHLGSIKRMVRGHNLPLEQVVKRVLEKEACEHALQSESNKKCIFSNKQVVIRGTTLKACGNENFALSKATRDSVFVTLDGK